MDRRTFLTAALATSALSLAGCTAAEPSAEKLATQTPRAKTTPPPEPSPEPPAPTEPPPPPGPPQRQYTPQFDAPYGPITALPPEVGNQFAWTVDDGASPEVVMAYAQFAERTGHHLTFFINGVYANSWAPAAAVLAPMIASGQVQIANHTYSHPSLTNISDAQIQDELMTNHTFIEQTFGVDARPWYRPPYGNRDARTDAAAAAVGYSAPAMWYGSLGDSGLIAPEIMMQEANRWLQPASLILGHANAPTVVSLFDQLNELVTSRGLETVTLNDVFRKPAV